MKETGLMFKAPLVRAILEGRKTQTRRIVKRLPLRINRDANAMEIDVANIENGEFAKRVPCPFGKPGDRIYVRETHAHHPQFAQMAFRADGEEFEDADGWLWVPKWTPAIHMKKEEARIWLEITGVRVERLQNISEADAQAEGCSLGCMTPTGDDSGSAIYGPGGFAALWGSTGGDWAANPWVWVIDFKTISTTGRSA